jgi:hypothetical protein
MTLEHPAVIHRRSAAIVRHVSNNDYGAAVLLFREAVEPGPEAATAQLVSFAQLCKLLMSQIPAEQRDALLNELVITLAAQEPPQDEPPKALS